MTKGEKTIKKSKVVKARKRPSERMKKAFTKMVENGGNATKALVDAGYSPATAHNPQKITESPAWKTLVAEHIGDEDLLIKHKRLLNATKIEHMTFPDGPRTEDEKERWLFNEQIKEDKRAEKEGRPPKILDCMSDEEIGEMLAEINCKLRRVVHGEMARHVYYWAMDNKAVKDALDMAYKIGGRYASGDGGNNLLIPIQVNVQNDRGSYSG